MGGRRAAEYGTETRAAAELGEEQVAAAAAAAAGETVGSSDEEQTRLGWPA